MHSRRRFIGVLGVVALAGCADDGGDGGPDGGADGDGQDGGGDGADDDGGTDGDGTDGSPTGTDTAQDGGGDLSFSTPAFEDGGTIPERHTGVGEDVSPELTVESVPENADTLALVVDDPDANNYVHWLIWNIPADTETIPEGIPQSETVDSLDGARQGTNDFGELGYRGPLPPAGDGPHTYRFMMTAVETTLDLAAGAGRGELESALDGSVLDTHEITGEFERES